MTTESRTKTETTTTITTETTTKTEKTATTIEKTTENDLNPITWGATDKVAPSSYLCYNVIKRLYRHPIGGVTDG